MSRSWTPGYASIKNILSWSKTETGDVVGLALTLTRMLVGKQGCDNAEKAAGGIDDDNERWTIRYDMAILEELKEISDSSGLTTFLSEVIEKDLKKTPIGLDKFRDGLNAIRNNLVKEII